ncbi:bacterial mobilization protein MobC [Actinomyces sp. ICM39]|nr:bacterial mobilization protein MobC [Actinomyces sp. ICM39]
MSVTSSERALIEEGARLRGVSLSRFVVEAALHPVTTSEGIAGPSHAEELIELLRAYRRQLEGAMTNLNQIAHHANTVHEVPEDFASVVSSVADTIEDINARLDGVRR